MSLKIKTIFLVYLTFFICSLVFAQEFPERSNPPLLVNDYAQLLSSDEQSFLETKLTHFDDSTSTQIAVVIMRSTGEYEIKDYAQRLAQNWGIGQQGKNNGIILLVAIEDRKMAIQTGYGLEGVITDAASKEIIHNIIRPYFKEKQYFQGIHLGTDAIMQLSKGEFKAAPKKKGSKLSNLIFLLIIILIIYFIIKSNSNKGGGGKYGRYTSRGGSLSDAMIFGNLLGGGRGGSWGRGSGGGFGGFGGGSFGGGGASGDW